MGSAPRSQEVYALMARVIPGRFTAQMDEPFVVFVIGMRLPLHKDPAAVDCWVIRAKSAGVPQYAPTVQPD
jgi:hypothetical protein